ncbi:MAG: ribosome biogenesis GTPase Der [Candidatus Dasytiphilus stammeri]
MVMPLIALVGRPNVGKSTLFNRLTNTHDALVSETPEMTRDRKYGYIEVNGHQFIIIDTGGLKEDEKGINKEVFSQFMQAINESELILLIVDAQVGLMPGDIHIMNILRCYKKTVFIIANKSEGNTLVSEFYSLGQNKIYFITALKEKENGINQLLAHIVAWGIDRTCPTALNESNHANLFLLKKFKHTPVKNNGSIQAPIKIAIIGRPNVGKSTLMNSIIGKEQVIVCNLPGTTRDSVYIPVLLDGSKYVLIDTAGVRKRVKRFENFEKLSVKKTLQAIKEANVIIIVIDAVEGIMNQDLSLLSLIINEGRSLVIIINKWDALASEMRKKLKLNLELRLKFLKFVRIHFISALNGTGIRDLFNSVKEAYHSSMKRVSTAILTRIMRMAIVDHHPPLYIKLKYAHSGGINPPIIVIHGNKVKELPQFYRNYLVNYFRRSLSIIGTPILLSLKEGYNPFQKKITIKYKKSH